jgi:peptidoglycan/xylan/chitin deacetylase (PgdA/CDA1 family)
VERDLVGYGQTPPVIEWPGGARIAVSMVINYEEGSESSPLYGDKKAETRGELPSDKPPGVRSLQTETQWEYGGRAGIWRLLRIFERYGVKGTIYACAMALENNPPVGPEIIRQGHDITAHGYRWVEQWHLDREAEREWVQKAADTIERMSGYRPLSYNTKGGPSLNTRELLKETGYKYDADGANDDLPYYTTVKGEPWLVVPYAFDTNDGKYWRAGWSDPDGFFKYLKNAFDVLYEEGATQPKLMSIGLHSRVSGHPGRAMSVASFLEYARSHEKVWFAPRDQIARWWWEHYPPS